MSEPKYEITPEMQARIDSDFKYHSPKPDQPSRYESIRAKAKELAEEIVRSTPTSPEQSVALTQLKQSVMWANASIAINE